MCGLAGLFIPGGASPERLRGDVLAMSNAIAYRGPDSHGIWVDGEAGVAFGHRRLAIIDLTSEGAQPMSSASHRFCIVYNGEIYNYLAIRERLAATGVHFHGASDTEVLLAGFEQWGVEATLAEANGMFAFALWDASERVLTLGRDRFGQKPMAYGWNNGVFLFGSELRALEAWPSFAAGIDPQALALLLRYGHVPAPHSIRAGIAKLPPGCLLRLGADAVPGSMPVPQPYWSASAVAQAALARPFAGSEADAVAELETLLRDAVRLCMVSDVPLGAFLSGGIDSSSVVALMQSLGGPPVRSFSIGFRDAAFDEARHARAVASHLGTEHTELYLDEAEALAVVPDLGRIFDEPFADSSQIPTYLVSRLARQAVTVSLSGDGGDELFGGYNRYALACRLGNAVQAMPGPLLALGLEAARAVPPGLLNAVRPLLGDRLHKLAAVLAPGELRGIYRQLMAMAPAVQVAPDGLLDRPGDWAELDDPRHMMMLLDAETYLPNDILVKLDRASMAVSLESRVPLLDHRLFEFAWRLPLAMKIAPGGSTRGGKSILRKVLHRHVPAALVERPKMGFGVPLMRWLNGPLLDWAETLLAPTALADSGMLDVAGIRRMWSEHRSCSRAWHNPLWCVLMFQAWRAAR
ncbi:MAG: asparagine synthase (glutamine-hydrolyzing) [Ferrovibrio sp.]|nr:asparagine synthase (glutamine-hydrolyzing) [Ferrovibrio sp.]